jgi:signal transduction histidine kinase
LGLAIAKYLVQAHGGEIGVISPSMMDQHGEGAKGITFYFTLPLAFQK